MDVAFIISLLKITSANHLYCAVDVVEELLAGKQVKNINKDINKGIYGLMLLRMLLGLLLLPIAMLSFTGSGSLYWQKSIQHQSSIRVQNRIILTFSCVLDLSPKVSPRHRDRLIIQSRYIHGGQTVHNFI